MLSASSPRSGLWWPYFGVTRGRLHPGLWIPIPIAGLSYADAGLLFFLGLSLPASLRLAFSHEYRRIVRRETGLYGQLLTGILAVVVATPCTAPFMGVRWLCLQQNAAVTFAVFTALALGLAVPTLP